MGRSPSNFCSLPKDMIFDICLRLPHKSILRFRCVCKSWQSIISSPQFIQTHLINSQKNPSILTIDYSFNDFVFSSQPINLDSPQDIVNLNLPLHSLITRKELVTSCNGILCLRGFRCGDIYLLNPLTRQWKTLPYPISQTFLCLNDDRVGFGFDYISNDYKVVKIAWGYNYNEVQVIQVDLFSTNASSWRQVDQISILNSMKTRFFRQNFRFDFCCVVQGVMYFRADDNVLSFDLHEEILGLVPLLPTEMKSKLFDFEGSLAFLSTSIFIAGNILLEWFDGNLLLEWSLWTLDDIGGILSWTKKFTFEHIDCQLLYLNAGKFVAYDDDHEELILFDYKNKTSKYLQIRSPIGYGAGAAVAIKYTKSLVSFQSICKLGPGENWSLDSGVLSCIPRPYIRKEGQDTQDELQKTNLREELEERERRHFSSKEDRDRRKGGHLLLEGTKRENEERIIPRSADADYPDPDADVKSDDESDDEDDDDEDDTEALLAELEQIKKERAEEKQRKERQEQEEQLKVKEAELIRGNPLLNNATSFNVKRRWDDDVVFKNQTGGETKTPKRFINDTIRSDFHRKFLHKYMK